MKWKIKLSKNRNCLQKQKNDFDNNFSFCFYFSLIFQFIRIGSIFSSIYLPIETTYSLLDHDYAIPIPRDELQECSQLRNKWSELMLNADRVRKQLLQERQQFQLEQIKALELFSVL